ncbi:MAG: hypothetical protein IJS89_06095, partial [Bacteroidaceae bacterium]|nr:hypothetical protein [Bacteroidaceae bacterium]
KSLGVTLKSHGPCLSYNGPCLNELWGGTSESGECAADLAQTRCNYEKTIASGRKSLLNIAQLG